MTNHLKNKHPKEYNDWLDSFCKNSNVKRVELTKPLGKVKGWSKNRNQIPVKCVQLNKEEKT
jgi:hypothetical protein